MYGEVERARERQRSRSLQGVAEGLAYSVKEVTR